MRFKTFLISALVFVFFLVGGSLRPSLVWAQSCSGTYSGTTSQGACSYNASAQLYTCSSTDYSYSTSCIQMTSGSGGCVHEVLSDSNCYLADGGRTCIVQGGGSGGFFTSGCTYTAGGGGGTPTPTPSGGTGVPGPCGGCSSCGAPSDQCRVDAIGNCVWDPGSCSVIVVCSPTCAPKLCGQSDGCGGTCAATDDGAPATPVISAPADGSVVTPNANGRISVIWAAVAKAEGYRIELYASANPDVDWTTTSGSLSGGDQSSYGKSRAFDSSTTTDWRSRKTGRRFPAQLGSVRIWVETGKLSPVKSAKHECQQARG